MGYVGGVGKINNGNSVHIDVRGYKCWFDETNDEKVVSSWYNYLKLRRKGDVDGDGKVTAADARLVLRAAAGLAKLDTKAKIAADVNYDGKVTAADAREILRRAAKLK